MELEDGYPTNETLLAIERLPYEQFDTFLCVDLPALAEGMSSYGCKAEVRNGLLCMTTGGWSGMEDIYGAMARNTLLYMMRWETSRRGGYHEFAVQDRTPSFNKYRKRPIVIEAVQFDESSLQQIREFGGESIGPIVVNSAGEKELHILTLEDGYDKSAFHVASIGDWIIKGVKGEFYPCKPDIFEATYEEA